MEHFRVNRVNIQSKASEATEKVRQVIKAAGLPVGPYCPDRRAEIVAQRGEGVEMKTGHELDELIKAAWGVIESDFDPVAFQHWRLKAFECLTAMFGPDHVYTKYFEHFVQQGDRANALAGGGVLAAAKQQWIGKEFESSNPLDAFGAVLPVTGTTGHPMRP